MAAVLCGGIGKACGACCECGVAICKAPFKLCGACCEGLGQCCAESCQLVTNCCTSPFCFYITVTLALNIPPIVIGLTDVRNAASGCNGSIWLLVFWLFCVVNIIAAFYMSRAVDRDADAILPPSNEPHGVSHFQQNAQNGASRMRHLFCYDGWMAVYILVVIAYFGWLFLGAGWFTAGKMDDHESCEDIMGKVGIAYGFGWAFVFCGGCALCCSMCCGVLNNRPASSRPSSQTQSPATAPAPAAAAAASATTASTTAASAKPTASTTTAAVIYASTTSNPAPSAPDEAEIPIAEATPIYDNNDKV